MRSAASDCACDVSPASAKPKSRNLEPHSRRYPRGPWVPDISLTRNSGMTTTDSLIHQLIRQPGDGCGPGEENADRHEVGDHEGQRAPEHVGQRYVPSDGGHDEAAEPDWGREQAHPAHLDD